MKKKSMTTIVIVFVCLLASQNLEAQNSVSGKVVSLQPKDGELLCAHAYGEAIATATITNGHENRSIRGRLVIRVEKRITNTNWDLIDHSTDIKLLDRESIAEFTVSCAKGAQGDEIFVGPGIYVAKVWLQWQYVDQDEENGLWFTLASPKPPYGGAEDGPIVDENTHHVFVIIPCENSSSDGAQSDN